MAKILQFLKGKERYYFSMLVQRSTRYFGALPNTEDDSDYARVVEKLNEYYSPQTNLAYELYNFHQTKQKDGKLLGRLPHSTSTARQKL